MDSIFGLPMNAILIMVVGLFALVLGTGAWIILRSWIIFKIGARNILRRPAQSILIVAGLMLSTLIISAAITTGDTLSHSIRTQVYDYLGQVDEIVVAGDRQVVVAGNGAGESSIYQPDSTMPYRVAEELRSNLDDDSRIQGVMGIIAEPVPVKGIETQRAEPSVVLTGLEPERVDAFGGISDLQGDSIDLSALDENEIVVSERLAESLNLNVRSHIDVYISGKPTTLRVHSIAPDSFLTGVHEHGANPGIAMPLKNAQELLSYQGEISLIAVTNRGGVEEGVQHSDAAETSINNALSETPYQAVTIKQASLEQAETASDGLTRMFLVLGLFSVAAGILLIFLIFVLLAAERKSEMGTARAIGMKRGHLMRAFIAEGMLYALGAALIGSALGVAVAFAIAGMISHLLGDVIRLEPAASWKSLVVAYCLGALVTFVTVTLSSWRISNLNIVAAIRNTTEHSNRATGRRWVIVGALGAVVGAGLTMGGIQAESLSLFGLGISILPLGAAAVLRRMFAARALYSAASALVLAAWILLFDWHGFIMSETTAGMGLFVIAGIMMVASATVFIIWNADVIVRMVGALGRRFSRWLPAVKTATAYSLANRSRSGLTIAMFSLVVFSLVVMATTNTNVERAAANENTGGGWDIHTTYAPAPSMTDLRSALAAEGVDADRITHTARLNTVPFTHSQVRLNGNEEWKTFTVRGFGSSFASSAETQFTARASGYETDEEVWQEVQNDPNLAVIDSSALPSGGFQPGGPSFELNGISQESSTMEPISIELADPESGDVHELTIIGIVDEQHLLLNGIYVSQRTFDDIYPTAVSVDNLLRIEDGVDAEAFAARIQGALLTHGVEATSVQAEINRQLELNRGFIRLVQGFMALGLIVGIAALGVVALRSVIERRQQIGMLRAIGYQRRMVSVSFLIESFMITALGVLSGTVLGLWLAYQLVTSNQFVDIAGDAGFVIPWVSVLIFVGITLGASLLMSYFPARHAARVPIAEALRFE